MVIDCLSVFLFSFGYLSVFVEEIFSFVYFHFSYSDIPYLSCSLSSFFNLPAPGLRGSSNTGRNLTHVISYI